MSRRRDNVVLIGFMGSGKSEAGKALADAMQMEFLDLDERIEKVSGETIPAIFEKQGEVGFRKIESEQLGSLKQVNHTVISTGGGIVTVRENHKPLRDLGPVIWLKVELATILARLDSDAHRPLLPKENRTLKVKEMLSEREPLYRQVADGMIETDNLSIDVVVRRVIKFLDAYHG